MDSDRFQPIVNTHSERALPSLAVFGTSGAVPFLGADFGLVPFGPDGDTAAPELARKTP